MKNVRRGWMELRINLALLKVIVAPAVVNWTNFYFVCTKFSAICSPKHRERDYLLCCYSVLGWVRYLPKILVDLGQTLGLSDTGQTWWQHSSWTSLVKCRGRIICLKLLSMKEVTPQSSMSCLQTLCMMSVTGQLSPFHLRPRRDVSLRGSLETVPSSSMRIWRSENLA